ncbi:MAG: hypothetical protein V1754_07315, partial [Pseudomonadota bacterium]
MKPKVVGVFVFSCLFSVGIAYSENLDQSVLDELQSEVQQVLLDVRGVKDLPLVEQELVVDAFADQLAEISSHYGEIPDSENGGPDVLTNPIFIGVL